MPDPDLEIWVGSSRSLDKGRRGVAGRSPPNFFSAVQASVWSENKGGGGGGNGPSPGSAIVLEWLTCITDVI